MVNFKKGCNWGRTEIKNWIATELKWKECMEDSCKQQNSWGSKVPLPAETSESPGPWEEWGCRDPSASGIPDMELSFPSHLVFLRNVCGLLWLNSVCYSLSLILVIPLLINYSLLIALEQGLPAPFSCLVLSSLNSKYKEVEILGILLSAILNPPSQKFEVIQQRSSFYCSNCNSCCVH